MAVLTDDIISVKEINQRSKYKNMEVEIEKIWYLKTTNVPVKVGTLNMIKKGINKQI